MVTLNTNKPSDWSSQDLGWSIPVFDIPNAQAGIDRVLQRIVDSGSKLIIFDFDWPTIQPSNPDGDTAGNNDHFNWTRHDLLMDRCAAFGIYVVAGCQYTPDWANGNAGDNKVPPSRDKVHYADYANFVWHVVDHYQTRTPNTLIAISVWNEPNTANQFWKDPDNHNGPYVVNYAHCLTGAYEAVHSGLVHAQGGDRQRTAHAEVMVGNGGMAPASGTGNNGSSYGWPQWVQGLIDNGATHSFDVFFVHPYMWQCNATETQYTWNPMNYIQPCYTKLKTAGRKDIYAWATEFGGGTRKDDSGTDPGSFDCSVGGPAGGYDNGAPAGKYNTSHSAVDYTTAPTRVTKDIAEWRSTDFYDSAADVNRYWSGPLFVWTLNDEAHNETTWNGSWQPHAGCYVWGGGDGTQGAAKPHAQTWIDSFSNNGHPGGGTDTTKPKTHIQTIDGIDVTTPTGGGGFPQFVTYGAGHVSEKEIDEIVALGASGIRMAADWDGHDNDPPGAGGAWQGHIDGNGFGDIDSIIEYCNTRTLLPGVIPAPGSVGLAVDLQIAIGPTFGGGGGTAGRGNAYWEHATKNTHGGSILSQLGGGRTFVNVPKSYAEFTAAVHDRYLPGNGLSSGSHGGHNGDDLVIYSLEAGNEPNHAKWDKGRSFDHSSDGFSGVCKSYADWVALGMPSEGFKGLSYVKTMAHISRLCGGTGGPIKLILGGLGGHRDDLNDQPAWDFTEDMYRHCALPSGWWGAAVPDGLKGLVDFFNQHPYCYNNLPSVDIYNGEHYNGGNGAHPARGFYEMVDLTMVIVHQYEPGLDTWVTEYGYPQPGATVQLASDGFEDAAALWPTYPWGGGPFSWFNFKDKVQNTNGLFGLVGDNLLALPLASGVSHNSIKVQAQLAYPLPAGTDISLTDGNNTILVRSSADVAKNATVIPTNSFTPSHTYPAGPPGPTTEVRARKQPLWNTFHDYGVGLKGRDGGTDPPIPTVSGTAVPITIYASDNVEVQRVDVYVDGIPVTDGPATLTAFGYEYNLDSTLLSNSSGGGHSLTSFATDTSGNQKLSIAALFDVNNGGPGMPNVNSVTIVGGNPTLDTAGGDQITIAGTNLKVGAVVPTVEVGTGKTFTGPLACTVTASSATSITATVPAHAEGTVHVRVTTTGGVSALGAVDKVSYSTPHVGAPSIVSISPISGPTAGGEDMLITGGFPGTISAVVFDDGTTQFAAAIVGGSQTPTTIHVTVPALAANDYDVRATNAIGTSPIAPGDRFTADDAPTVTISLVDDDVLSGAAYPIVVGATDAGDPNPVVQLVVDKTALNLVPIRVDAFNNPDPAGDFYLFYLNTFPMTNDRHTIRGIATNNLGIVGKSSLAHVSVLNDKPPPVEPPTCVILSPSTGSEISGVAAPFSIQSIDDNGAGAANGGDAIVPDVELWITETVNRPPTGGFTLGISALGGGDTLAGALAPSFEAGTPTASFPDYTPAGWDFDDELPSPEAFAQEFGESDPRKLVFIGFGVPDGSGQVFLVQWDTTTVPNGTYQMQGRAEDSRQQERWSAPILVTVNNPIIHEHPGAPDDRWPWRLYVRNGLTFQRIAEIKQFHSLDTTSRFDDIGVFTLVIPAADPTVPLLVEGLLDDPPDGYNPNPGIILYYKNKIAFSGDVTEAHRTVDSEDSWEIVGEDDNAFARNAFAHASPTEAAPSGGFFAHSADSKTAPAESLIWYYIDRNIGPSATSNRRIPALQLGAGPGYDQGRGTVIDASPRFSNLLVDLQKIAAASTPVLGFRITQVNDETHPLHAEVYVPIDRSALVRFSTRYGNLTSFAYDLVAPVANVILAAGKGAAENRQFVQLEDAASIGAWRRREVLTDHTDATDLTQLTVDAVVDIVQNEAPPSISLEPKDIDNARYLDDYNLGDKVTFVLPEGTVFADIVVAVAIRIDSTGVLVKPAVGAGPQDVFAVFAETRRLADAVQALQTTREPT